MSSQQSRRKASKMPAEARSDTPRSQPCSYVSKYAQSSHSRAPPNTQKTRWLDDVDRSGNYSLPYSIYPSVEFENTPPCQLVRIMLDSASSTGSPASCRVSFPPSAVRVIFAPPLSRHHHSHHLPPPPRPPTARQPARVYSTNHQATMRIP